MEHREDRDRDREPLHWGESGFFDQEAYDRSLARLAHKLEISLDLLETPGDCTGAQAAHEEAMSVLLLSSMQRMADMYRLRHLLDETHALSVSLGRELFDVLLRRGEIHRDGDGGRLYVMAYGEKIWVEDERRGEDIIEGFVDGIGEGAKRQAPTTGPRPNMFTRRGKMR